MLDHGIIAEGFCSLYWFRTEIMVVREFVDICRHLDICTTSQKGQKHLVRLMQSCNDKERQKS